MESLRDWLRPGEARAKFPGMGNSERAAKGYGSERSISSRESIGISRKRSRPWKTAIAVALLSAAMVVPSQQASAVSLPTMTKHWDVVKSLEMSHQANRELLETLRSEVKSFRQGVESLKQLAQAPSFVDLPPSSFSYPPTPANEAADTAAQSTEDNFGGPSESWMHVYDMPSEHGDSNGPRQRTEYHYNDDKHKQDDSDLSTVTPAGEEAYDPFERPFTHMSAISRNDGPLELTGITRHGSMEDIVMMDQNVKPVDELVCFLDLDKCSIYGAPPPASDVACRAFLCALWVLCGCFVGALPTRFLRFLLPNLCAISSRTRWQRPRDRVPVDAAAGAVAGRTLPPPPQPVRQAALRPGELLSSSHPLFLSSFVLVRR
eukprot:3814261-Rhodomonas_salina.1